MKNFSFRALSLSEILESYDLNYHLSSWWGYPYEHSVPNVGNSETKLFSVGNIKTKTSFCGWPWLCNFQVFLWVTLKQKQLSVRNTQTKRLFVCNTQGTPRPKFWFSSTPQRKVKNDILKESHWISQNEALFFCSIYCGLSNAGDKPLLFGFLNERAVSITCPQKELEPKKNASFCEILWGLSICHF